MISHCRSWNFPEQTATRAARGKSSFQDAASMQGAKGARWSLFSWAEQTGLGNLSPGLKAISSKKKGKHDLWRISMPQRVGKLFGHPCLGMIPLAASHSNCWQYPSLCSTPFFMWWAVGLYMSSYPEVGNLPSTQSPDMCLTRAWVHKSFRHCTNHRSMCSLKGR